MGINSMANERINPLNDFIFLKIMGEKGDEEQLLAFLNAVLKRPEDKRLESIEIIENKAITADIINGKSCALDVRAVLGNGERVEIEVQLQNPGNMDRRSLFYWSREFTKGLVSGQEYEEVPNVIAINILGYNFLKQVPDFHTTFHIWEDTHREIMLTDALEIHFINMVKFRSLKERDIRNNLLHRWLTYFDNGSPEELVEEVIKMDIAIQKVETKMRSVSMDEEAMRIYEMREKALLDWNSSISYARKEGKLEEARNMTADNMPTDKIIKYTGRVMEGKWKEKLADKGYFLVLVTTR
jgi:predicted transposase/invertase (TIGR01784 family)